MDKKWTMGHTLIKKYLHRNSDEYEKLWDIDAPQQEVAHYWLYEVELDLDVDLDTGNANIISVNGVPLVKPTPA